MLAEIGGEFFEADDIVCVKQSPTPWVAEVLMRGSRGSVCQSYGPQHGSEIKTLVDRINAAKSRAPVTSGTS